MYAITGVTGKVGGATARALLAAGQSVRAVVRNVDKGQVWKNLGCEVALATIEHEASLSVAFQRAEAVEELGCRLFLEMPPGHVSTNLVAESILGVRAISIADRGLRYAAVVAARENRGSEPTARLKMSPSGHSPAA
jgi:NAD(P)-dependent dehydrogenase (short-subunit alcohol dehydrogenase family)